MRVLTSLTNAVLASTVVGENPASMGDSSGVMITTYRQTPQQMAGFKLSVLNNSSFVLSNDTFSGVDLRSVSQNFFFDAKATSFAKEFNPYARVSGNLLSAVTGLVIQNATVPLTVNRTTSPFLVNMPILTQTKDIEGCYFFYSAGNTSLWKRTGCIAETPTDGTMVCNCYHLTDFSVISTDGLSNPLPDLSFSGMKASMSKFTNLSIKQAVGVIAVIAVFAGFFFFLILAILKDLRDMRVFKKDPMHFLQMEDLKLGRFVRQHTKLFQDLVKFHPLFRGIRLFSF